MSKHVFITGANTGLGLEIVKSLCRSPSQSYTILVGCRNIDKGETAIKQVTAEYPEIESQLSAVQVDLSSDSSIDAAIETITTQHAGRLDILVNNGGGNFDQEYHSGQSSLRAAWNKSWDTNVSGTNVLTNAAIPLLLKSSDPRIIFMTSGTASMQEVSNPPNEALRRMNASPAAGWPKPVGVNPTTAYRSTKSGLNMLMCEWNRILKEDGVKVWCVSPGFLATGLAGIGVDKLKQMGALDPSVGADFTVDVMQGKRDGDVGKIVRNNGAIQPW